MSEQQEVELVQLYSPNGAQIMGTDEELGGRADVAGFFQAEDGTWEYEHDGGTEIFGGETLCTPDGKDPLFIDDDGESWPLSMCSASDERRFTLGCRVRRVGKWAPTGVVRKLGATQVEISWHDGSATREEREAVNIIPPAIYRLRLSPTERIVLLAALDSYIADEDRGPINAEIAAEIQKKAGHK